MNQTEFQKVADVQIEWCQKTLGLKRGEYEGSGGDRFHNFKIAAALDGESPEKALWGIWKKHLVSLKDIVDGTAEGKVPATNLLIEKIGDTINYMLLLRGLLTERQQAMAA